MLIKDNPEISITSMSRILNVSTTAIEKTLKRMKQNGRVRRVGNSRSSQ